MPLYGGRLFHNLRTITIIFYGQLSGEYHLHTLLSKSTISTDRRHDQIELSRRDPTHIQGERVGKGVAKCHGVLASVGRDGIMAPH